MFIELKKGKPNVDILYVWSNFFGGMTAILAKIGIKNIYSNVATTIRTMVIFNFFMADNSSGRLIFLIIKYYDFSHFICTCNWCFLALLF